MSCGTTSDEGGLPLQAEEHWQIALDHPVRPTPRYGYGKPPHALLHALIAERRDGYAQRLNSARRYESDFVEIPLEPTPDCGPYWRCGWLRCLDLVTLYALLVDACPHTYFEVGSGCSTQFVRRAIIDHDLPTRVVSVDPNPRDAIDSLCDEILREPLEDIDPIRFAELAPGGVVFVDGSHRTLPNSDVTAFFLDMLPSLPPGVYVGIHDSFLPYDYPPRWSRRFYSEQYMLGVYLLAGPPSEIILANAFVSNDSELSAILLPLWERLDIDPAERWGSSCWLRMTERG